MVIYLSNIAGVESPGKVSLWSGTPVSRSLSSRTMLKHHIVCAQYRNQKNEDKMQRRLALQALVASLALLEGTSGVGVPPWPALAEDWRTLSEDEWKARLTKEQFGVLRKAGTELPLSSPLNKEYREGTYYCAGCGSKLFYSSAKYNSGTGWPSFSSAIQGAVDEVPDYSIAFIPRTEVKCHTCRGHLGHVFDDGPPPTGLRYCMNGIALTFKPGDA